MSPLSRIVRFNLFRVCYSSTAALFVAVNNGLFRAPLPPFFPSPFSGAYLSLSLSPPLRSCPIISFFLLLLLPFELPPHSFHVRQHCMQQNFSSCDGVKVAPHFLCFVPRCEPSSLHPCLFLGAFLSLLVFLFFCFLFGPSRPNEARFLSISFSVACSVRASRPRNVGCAPDWVPVSPSGD